LYKQWIRNSLEDPKSRILVVRSGKQLAGFITFEFLDSGVSKFGLIAVDENIQSRGLGSLLIKMAEDECFDCDKFDVQVVTHLENKPAMAVLKKNGYIINGSDFIYHLWNK